MTIVVGDILRTSMQWQLPSGDLYQNVFHHKRTGIGIISDATHVSTIKDWAEAMYGEIVTLVNAGTVERLSFVDLVEFVAGAWKVTENIGTFTADVTMSAAGDICPNQVSPFIVFKTPRPKTVGRKFLFPSMESDQNQGILIGAAITKYVAWADDAVNDIVIQVGDNLVPGVPRTGVDEWQEFNVAVVTDLVGTQRRRRPGEGA